MLLNNKMLLSVSKENMQNKNYNLYLTVIANTMGYVDKENNYRLVPKAEIRAFLRDNFKLTKYKIKTLLDTYKMLELIDEKGSDFIFYPVKKNFVNLSFSTTLYFLDMLSDFVFKVYCWLLNKYDLHLAYFKGKDNYFFNKKELLEGVGYANSAANRKRLDDALMLLEKLDYIQYNHQYVGRPGKHGLYLELYKVNKYGNAQIKSAKETIKSLMEQNVTIDTDMALRLWVPGTEEDIKLLMSDRVLEESEESKEVKKEMNLEDKAKTVKEGMAKGFPWVAFEKDYQQAYKEVYGE